MPTTSCSVPMTTRIGPPPLAIPPGRRAAAATIAQLIVRETEGAKPYLRPDAKLFLLTNLTNLVIAPIARAGGKRRTDAAMKAIASDIKLIISEAARRRASKSAGNNSEITSGDIIAATAKLWDKLKINEFKFWA